MTNDDDDDDGDDEEDHNDDGEDDFVDATTNNDTTCIAVLTIIARPWEACLGQVSLGCSGSTGSLALRHSDALCCRSPPHRAAFSLHPCSSCNTGQLNHEGAHHHLRCRRRGLSEFTLAFATDPGVIGSTDTIAN